MKEVESVAKAGLDVSVAAPGRLTTGFVDGTVQPCACTGASMAHAGFGLPAQPATDRRSSGASTPGPRRTQPAATDQDDPQPKPLDPSPQPHPPPLTPGRLIEGAALVAALESDRTARRIDSPALPSRPPLSWSGVRPRPMRIARSPDFAGATKQSRADRDCFALPGQGSQ